MSNEMTVNRSFFERAFWPVAVILALLLLLLTLLGYGPSGRHCASCLEMAAAAGIAAAPAVVAPVVAPPVVVPARGPASDAVAPSGTPPVESAAAGEPAVQDVAGNAARPVPQPARVYFARDSDLLPADAGETLRGMVDYLGQVRAARVTVSGFHDPSGNPLYNEDLARRRAVAVQAALRQAGVEAGQIELVKPLVTDAGGANWEARRVEVAVIAGP